MNTFPASLVLNTGNCRLAQTISLHERGLKFTRSVDRHRLIGSNFGVTIILPAPYPIRMGVGSVTGAKRPALRMRVEAMPLAGSHPPFGRGIGQVGGRGSEKQMRRVHAGWRVAAVADKQAGAGFSVRDHPGHPMSAEHSAAHFRAAAHSEAPVTSGDRRARAGPKPAARRLANLCPKPSQVIVCEHKRDATSSLAGVQS